MAKTKYVQVENKNAILEILREGKTVSKIYIAANAYKDSKTTEILQLARAQKTIIVPSTRKVMNKMIRGSSAESMVAFTEPENQWSLKDLLDKIYSQNMTPFFLVLDHLKYDQNVGAILRTAYAAGVNGVITAIKRESFVSSEALRISMGAALRVPIVEMNLFAALKMLKENAIRIYAVTMDGKTYFKEDLRGAVAFVLGAEDVGISTRVMEKVDTKISIPMREGIGSLNVGASASAICYEKLRQEVSPS